MEYVALLRGIGPGNPNMRNDKLRGVLEGLGFDNVRSVISSGNVLFEADSTDAAALEARIEAAWPEQLGFQSTTILRSRPQLERLVAGSPFGDREDTDSSRLQATFLKEESDQSFDLPLSPADGGGYAIVAIVDGTVCSTIDLSGSRTPGLMRWLEKTFGKQITTRTWKTVHRIVRRMEEEER
jgi:uncharacterized protein (DUF1697 family)